MDLTSVIEGQGREPKIQPVELVAGSSDPVALDTIAAEAIGYGALTVWTSLYGQKVGLGTNQTDKIDIRGIDWADFKKRSLAPPEPPRMGSGNLYDQATRFINNTVLRPRPVISVKECTGCGDCASRCPASAIAGTGNSYAVDLKKCADCGCCIKICDASAVSSQFIGLGKMVRALESVFRLRDQKRHD